MKTGYNKKTINENHLRNPIFFISHILHHSMQACFLCPTQTYHIDHWTDRLCSCGYHLSNYLFQYFTDVLTAPRPMHQNIRMVISTSKRGGLHRSLTIFTGIGLFCSLLKTWGFFVFHSTSSHKSAFCLFQ